MIELAQIVKQTGVSKRRLRYVLDHGLVQHVGEASSGRGVPRHFDFETATALAVAGLMLDAGLRRSVVKAATQLLQIRPLFPADPGETPSMFENFGGGWIHRLEVGDGQFYRSSFRSPDGARHGTTDWQDRGSPDQEGNESLEQIMHDRLTGRVEHQEPMVIVAIDVEAIRQRLGRAASSAS